MVIHLGLRTPFFIRSAGLLLALAVLVSPAAAQNGHGHDGPVLGAVHFDVSCRAVSDDFDRAVAFLHHMQYEESRAAFEAIAQADERCVMAHWGIAMTLFQPLWPARPSLENLRRGWSEVQKARALGPGGDRETGLLEATAAFFRDPDSTDYWTRISRWAEAMSATREAFPADREDGSSLRSLPARCRPGRRGPHGPSEPRGEGLARNLRRRAHTSGCDPLHDPCE